MSNEKKLVLFCRADGKWAVYDDTYDITIHCESKQEQDKTMELLRKVNRDARLINRPAMMAMENAVSVFLPTGIFEEEK